MKNITTLLLLFSIFSCCTQKQGLLDAPQNFQGDVWTFYPTTPVLKGQEQNVLAKISIRIPQGQGGQTLETLQIKLGGETDLKDIEQLEVFSSGSNPEMEGAVLLASVKATQNSQNIPCKTLLNAGENFLWLSCKLAEAANIQHKIEAQVEKAQLDKYGSVSTKSANPATPKYIGWALRRRNQEQVHTYRIPGLVTTKQGTLIAVYDVRYENDRDLPANIDVAINRSKDGGQSWEPMKIIMDMGPGANDGIGDPSILVDEQTGTIWVAALWSHGNKGWFGSAPGLSPDETGQFVLVKSEDDGQTWSKPINITPQVKNPAWRLFFQGPGMGICLRDGTLVFPAQFKDADAMPHSTLIYSKDHGQSWKAGTGAKSNTTEAQVVELNDGSIMLNMRDNRGGSRSVAVTNDLGQTWVEHATSRSALIEPVCMASIIRVASRLKGDQRDIIAFSNPSDAKERKNMSIKLSMDEGKSWPVPQQLLIDERKCYGYSCMSMIDKNTLGLIYEGVRELYFVRVPLKDIVKN